MAAGESVSFVFDVNVVKRGKTGEYNLLPVISESGVAAEDVEVTEVDEDGEPTGTGAANGTADAAADGNETDATGTEEPVDDGDGDEGDGEPDDEGNS